MDNYIDDLGEPSGDQEQPAPEDTDDFSETGYQPQTPPPSEPDTQYEMPDFPEGPDRDARLWATFCHLAAFSGYIGIPFGSILGPLIVWLIKKEESAYVDDNGKKALNFQISIAIYTIASLVFVCLGPLVLIPIIGLAITDLIFTIIAAIKANNGEEVTYPISIEFIK